MESGYRTAATTIIGTTCPGDDPLMTKRLPVNEWDDNRFMTAKLRGAYDWLHTPQYWSKKVSGVIPHGARRAHGIDAGNCPV